MWSSSVTIVYKKKTLVTNAFLCILNPLLSAIRHAEERGGGGGLAPQSAEGANPPSE